MEDGPQPEESPVTRKPAKVFFCYAHEDEKYKDKLIKHVTILKRQSVIETWNDRMIGAGQEWRGEIDHNLEDADVILLLVSDDFLASDYCWDVEMKRALERYDAGVAKVVPVILRTVDWHGAPFAKLQALPKNAKAVKEWPDEDVAFTDIARGIRAVVEHSVVTPWQHTAQDADKAELPKGERISSDPIIADVLQKIDQQRAISIDRLVNQLSRLFNRKTFRHESTRECAAQLWDHRLKTAMETYSLLCSFDEFVSKHSPEHIRLFREIVGHVDSYCDKMAGYLFQSPVDIVRLRRLGEDEFLAALPEKKFFSEGLPEEVAQTIDNPRAIAIACMDQLEIETAHAKDRAQTMGSTTSPPSEPPTTTKHPGSAGKLTTGALTVWKEKLDYLQQQEAITSDPAQRFSLSKQIEEAREKIQELSADR